MIPFNIAIPDSKITRLKQKLSLSDFPSEVETVDSWARGSPLADIKRLALYWEREFDWRRTEAHLNGFPQYIAKIDVECFDTYNVHFVHQTSAVKNAIPLLFMHSWPGSFLEVTKMLPELVKGGEGFPAFHVVAPSLIGFGFSEGSKKVSSRIEIMCKSDVRIRAPSMSTSMLRCATS